MRSDDELDVLDLAPALASAIRHALTGEHEAAASWYFKLRDLCAKAIAIGSAGDYLDMRERVEAGHLLRRIKARSIPTDRRLDAIVRLAQLDELLEKKLNRLSDDDDGWRLRALGHVKEATRGLAEWLGPDVGANVPPSHNTKGRRPEDVFDFWGRIANHSVITRGEDLEQRRFRPSRPRAPASSTEAKRALTAEKRLEARLVRIIRLLKRTPDRSANAIRSKLRMGRAELANALNHGRETGRLGVRGSLEDPSYFVPSDPIRKTPELKPPHRVRGQK